ncbi:hypothetical protein Ga0100231_003760 [Opitutaceae bacterium TAV4]|nr:hypothetical protein Ga0100231_003760 [Opitutaceae bacterium TAV4]RRK02042.1 hypothetical protein Ga0100230_002190 [Opitutaceae bacterium TAV3]
MNAFTSTNEQPKPPPAARDMQSVVDAALATLVAARFAPGRYARWLGNAREQRGGSGGEGGAVNPYGCADAANILYTLGHFPRTSDADEARERDAAVRALQEMQNADSGLFCEATHHTYHVTAHCAAALELFDARPRHPLRTLGFLDAPDALENFLEQLDWKKSPWNSSHQGAGIFAARVIAGEATPGWQERYFAWLWREADEVSGFWRRGAVATSAAEAEERRGAAGDERAPLFHSLAGSFHYLFNHEHARRPLRFPSAMIDSCLRIRAQNQHPTLGAAVSFAEVDWVYCLTRASRQCAHRFAEAQAALREFAAEYCDFLLMLVRDARTQGRPPFEDLHTLFGMLCALAELQTALPGTIRTARPLHLVLDRRPFI